MEQELAVSGQYNAGYLCTGRQCELGRGNDTALRLVDVMGDAQDFSYAALDALSGRFANVLAGLGCRPGDVVFTFLPKCIEQFCAFLGSLKFRAVTGSLFINFGPEALLDRLGDSRARVFVTRRSLLKKLRPVRSLLPALEFIILTDADEHAPEEGIYSYRRLMEESSDSFPVAITPADAPSVLHYTSGSTGKPKGVLHRHGAILWQHETSRIVLGLDRGTRYWCTADPGWVTGVSYGMLGPWSRGALQIHYTGGFDAGRWFDVLEREKIEVWYTAPTALRMLMREDDALYCARGLESLRTIFSVGEPLNPEVIFWSRRVLGRDIYDTWFQTETGGIMISNRPGLEIRPGSMGRPVPGIEAGVLDAENRSRPAGVQGRLCVKKGWPSMFTAYLNNPDVYGAKFSGEWYDSSDMACTDADGYFWFSGRSDDVINTAGHLVSPFEVESALLEIPEIQESAVVGVPDEMLFEKVLAFVCLKPQTEYDLRELELKIRLHVANRVSSTATPQEVRVVDSVPKNKSGKIMRRVLKARYLGLDTGDISTLEE